MYTRAEDLWTEQTILVASDGAPDDIFGVSVAVDGSYIVVGSRLNCDSLQHEKNSCFWRVPEITSG